MLMAQSRARRVAAVGAQKPRAPEKAAILSDGMHGFPRPQGPGTRRTFNHFTHPSLIQLTSSAALWAVSLPESHRRWLGSARPAPTGGQPAAEPKNPSGSGSAWCKPCPWEGNSFKCNPHWTLSPAPNSQDKTPCLLPSEPAELFPGKHSQGPGGGTGWEKGGTTSPDCSFFRSTAPFILPYVDLSICSPVCHMWLQKPF